MTHFTTEVIETLLNKANLDDLFRRHLELAINSLLQAELTTFLYYAKYDRVSFNSVIYSCLFKTEYGEFNLNKPSESTYVWKEILLDYKNARLKKFY